MPRYSAGMTAAGAGTTVRPIFGILSTAAVVPRLREVSLWNTTAVSCVYRLVYATGGTPGATVTAYDQVGLGRTPTVLAKQLWTGDATITADTGYRVVLGAAVGSAAILTFGDLGVSNPLGSTIALGLIPVGTGQVCEVTFVWDE